MRWFKNLAKYAVMMVPMSAAISNAYAADTMIEGAKLCTQHLPRFEREYAIPTHLLSAIATTESGRYHEGLRMKLPWPWSINANGKGYWFETKAEAIAAVKRLHAHGIKSIDVGCMQVNLYHHPEAFASLSEAFEPQTNIAYAAGFLHTLHDEAGSWKKAAGDYHSKTPRLGQEYVNLVYNSWYTIIDKLRAARLSVPESSVAAMNELKTGNAQLARATSRVTSPHVIKVATVAEPVTITRANQPMTAKSVQVAAYQPTRMNSISISTGPAVASEDERRRSIIVVRSGDNATGAAAIAPPAPAQTQAQPQMAANTLGSLAPSAGAATAQPVLNPAIKIPDKSQLVPQTANPQQAEYKTAAAEPVIPQAAITRIHSDQSVANLPELKPISYNQRRQPDLSLPVRTGPNFIFND